LQPGRWIPSLRLQPPRPGLYLGPSIHQLNLVSYLPQLHRGPLVHQIRQAPSSPRIHLGRSSINPSLWTALLWLRLFPSPPRLHWTPYSLLFLLGPHSLCLHRALLCPRLHLSRQSRRLHHVPPDPWRRLGSSALPWSPLSPASPLSVGPQAVCTDCIVWLPASSGPSCLLSALHLLFILLLSPLPPSAVGLSRARGRAYREGGVLSHVSVCLFFQ
ncbi:hypothetical protein PO909_009192, partial [Leuciscus waleckii]